MSRIWLKLNLSHFVLIQWTLIVGMCIWNVPLVSGWYPTRGGFRAGRAWNGRCRSPLTVLRRQRRYDRAQYSFKITTLNNIIAGPSRHWPCCVGSFVRFLRSRQRPPVLALRRQVHDWLLRLFSFSCLPLLVDGKEMVGCSDYFYLLDIGHFWSSPCRAGERYPPALEEFPPTAILSRIDFPNSKHSFLCHADGLNWPSRLGFERIKTEKFD